MKDKQTRIEFYPASGFYLPIYNGKYLNRNYITGVIELTGMIECADTYKTQAEAKDALDLAIEQRGKVGVEVIPYNS